MVNTTKKTSKSTTKPVRTTKASSTRKKKPASNIRESRTSDFMVVQFTRDTLYWLVFGLVAVIFAFWVTSLQRQVNELYDQVNTRKIENRIIDEQQKFYKEHPDTYHQKNDN